MRLKLMAGIAAVSVFVADIVSKNAIVDALAAKAGPIEITPFFRLVMVWNKGITFGAFGGGGHDLQPLILAGVALAIVAGLLFWLARTKSPMEAVAIGLVTGGAMGNIRDRLIHGAVADFFDVYAGEYHWPAFNVADSAICVGVFLLVLKSFLEKKDEKA